MKTISGLYFSMVIALSSCLAHSKTIEELKNHNFSSYTSCIVSKHGSTFGGPIKISCDGKNIGSFEIGESESDDVRRPRSLSAITSVLVLNGLSLKVAMPDGQLIFSR